MDRATREKINKKTEDLNNTINQLDLRDIINVSTPLANNSTIHILLKCTWNATQDRLYAML